VKRALAVLMLAITVATVIYGYTMTRRERLYRRAVLQGELAMARGDAFGAIGHFDEAIALKPEAMLGYLKRGEARFRRGELELAAADFSTASSRDATATRALELAGDVEIARQQPARAAEQFAAFVRIDDRSPRVLYKLGLARLLMGQPADAADALTRAIGIDSRFADAHYLLGMCLRDLQRPRDAQRALERAVALAPASLAAREQLADLYAASGNRAGRIRQLEALFEADPREGRQLALAQGYAEANQTTRAVRLLAHATERYPDQASAYVALGRLWFDQARDGDPIALGKALEALQQAASMQPAGRTLGLLGETRLIGADTLIAERTLQQAVEKLPAERSTFLHLADAAERIGRLEEARTALVDYYSLSSPTDRRRAEIARRIAQLSARLDDPAAAAHWSTRSAAERALDKDSTGARSNVR
jgi:tetratricopeptide (TPR) repeat protein